jgi:hypothetical protein
LINFQGWPIIILRNCNGLMGNGAMRKLSPQRLFDPQVLPLWEKMAFTGDYAQTRHDFPVEKVVAALDCRAQGSVKWGFLLGVGGAEVELKLAQALQQIGLSYFFVHELWRSKAVQQTERFKAAGIPASPVSGLFKNLIRRNEMQGPGFVVALGATATNSASFAAFISEIGAVLRAGDWLCLDVARSSPLAASAERKKARLAWLKAAYKLHCGVDLRQDLQIEIRQEQHKFKGGEYGFAHRFVAEPTQACDERRELLRLNRYRGAYFKAEAKSLGLLPVWKASFGFGDLALLFRKVERI